MEMPVKKDTCPQFFRHVTDRQELCRVMFGSNISKADYQEITRQIQFDIPFDWVGRSCSEAVRAPIMESMWIDNVDINAAALLC